MRATVIKIIHTFICLCYVLTFIDANDNDPSFAIGTYSVNQDEDIAIGTTVVTVAATDDDIGLYGNYM